MTEYSAPASLDSDGSDDEGPPGTGRLESRLLRPILQRKRCSIPSAVTTWLYFKHHVLEMSEARSAFEAAPSGLDIGAFKELLMAHARPDVWAPRKTRGSPSTTPACKSRQVWLMARALRDRYYPPLLDLESSLFAVRPSLRHGGFGLFARRTVILLDGSVVPGGMIGLLHPVSRDDWERLTRVGYPSRYSDGKVDGIMVGPLSVVNHSCDSAIVFRTSRQPRSGPKSPYIIEAVARKLVILAPGAELLVHYGELWFACHCTQCSPTVSG